MPIPPLVAPVEALSEAERARTARHTSLAALGEVGQRRLAAAHVAIVGAGGLGSPAILALAAAGVGTLTVIDDDVVELSNLQRQVLHSLGDLGRPKTASAERASAGLSPETRVNAVRERLTPANAVTLLRGADLVLDGSDTFPTREAVAAATEELGIPLVWGAIQSFDAQVTVFWSTPTVGDPVLLRDLYPIGSADDAPTCEAVGVLGALCLQVGALMATEGIKLIAGIGEPLIGRVLVIDGLNARQSEVALRRSATTPTRQVADAAPPPPPEISVSDAAEAIAAGMRVIDVREPVELAAGMIDGAVSIPLADLLAAPAAAAPGPVLVVCAAGGRARRAAAALLAAGVEATVLAGGMHAWDAERTTPVAVTG
ncbi:ThiF family adenylyltransferase [uncultured Microbacterium sp.]|uniref:ThiF family adenylyltransferase n=1 Tax=uncultured Microbacterium sp. TaxID=191216 RepID=UPI0035CBFF8B